MTKEENQNHYCDNINCNHNDTKGLCCLFNPDNCKYRQLQKENAELKEINEGYCKSRDRLISIGFPNFKDCKEYAEHLNNAKELIKRLMHELVVSNRPYDEVELLVKDVEQFLNSEVEK